MDKELILKELKHLFANKNFQNIQEARSWADNCASLLKLIDDNLYNGFFECSSIINIDYLSPEYIRSRLNYMFCLTEQAIVKLNLQTKTEHSLPDKINFPPNNYLDIQKEIAKRIRARNRIFMD